MELLPLPLDPLKRSAQAAFRGTDYGHKSQTGSRLDGQIDPFQYLYFLPAGIRKVDIVESDGAVSARRKCLANAERNSG